jgi:hypothetical protein
MTSEHSPIEIVYTHFSAVLRIVVCEVSNPAEIFRQQSYERRLDEKIAWAFDLE